MPEYTELQSATGGDAAAIIESTATLTGAALPPTPYGEEYPDVVREITPPGWHTNTLDLERFAEFPRRKRANIDVGDTASLVRYLNLHRTPGTTVYADPDPDALSMVAILDDHIPSVTDADNAQHREHRAALTLQKTPGCERWYQAHGRYMDQEAFAQMVEDGLTEIADPSGADLLEMAQTMQSTMTAEFRSSTRLATGQTQFAYVENGTATAGATGQMEIPEMITLVFAPFFGADPIQIDARLRYRIRSGSLSLGVWLVRHVEALRTAFEAEVAKIETQTEDASGESVTVLYGTP